MGALDLVPNLVTLSLFPHLFAEIFENFPFYPILKIFISITSI